MGIQLDIVHDDSKPAAMQASAWEERLRGIGAFFVMSIRAVYFLKSGPYGRFGDVTDRNGAEHDNKNGQFTSKQGSSEKGEEKQQATADPITKERLDKACDWGEAELQKPGANYADVVHSVAEAIRGTATFNIDGVATEIRFGRSFVRECRKGLSDPNLAPEEIKKIALRRICAIRHTLDFAKPGGVIGGWHCNKDKNHHPHTNYYTIAKEFVLNGETRWFLLDITRPNENPDNGAKSAHSINAEGNPTFPRRASELGLKKHEGITDGATPCYEVVGLRIV